MVHPNELRFGNWVINAHIEALAPETGKYVQIDKLDDYRLHMAAYENLKPIQLDADMLENLGFGRFESKDSVCYAYGDCLIEETNGGYELFGSEWTIGATFYYVHQLQNIYFFVFGEEINFSLTGIH